MQRGDASQKIGLSLSRAGIRKIDLAQPRRLGADAASGSGRGLWIGAASGGERENEDNRREQRGFESESESAHTIPPWRIALFDFRPAVIGDARMIVRHLSFVICHSSFGIDRRGLLINTKIRMTNDK
jgi:hypothetical protein